VDLLAGEEHALQATDLHPSAMAIASAKGGEPSRPIGITLAIAAGVEEGIANGVPAHGSLHLGVASAKPSGWSAGILVGTGRGAGFCETPAFALGGYRLGFERRRLRAYLGLEAGVGLVAQNVDGGRSLQTPAVVGAPELGLSIRATSSIAVAFEFQFVVG